MELRNGVTVRESAVDLALLLERRGHFLSHVDGTLRVTRAATLTPDDMAAIRREKLHLIAIADYVQSGACDARG